MHLERTLKPRRVTEINENHRMSKISNGGSYAAYADEGELEEIFKRTYGPIKRERNNFKKRIAPVERIIIPDFQKKTAAALNKERYLLVDGYNIIFAWEELKKTAAVNLDAARNQLTDILANYKGWKEDTVILVFDAYKVQGGTGSVSEQHGIHVIYTKEAETADQYIERAVHKMGRGADITVATSDNQVQMIIWGDGARRLSARELKVEIDAVNEKIRSSEYLKNRSRNYPLKSLSEELSDKK